MTPQAKRLLEYLLGNSRRKIPGKEVTGLIAMTNLGIASLTARVAELRAAGWTVKDKIERDHFQRRYKRYWMGKRRVRDE